MTPLRLRAPALWFIALASASAQDGGVFVAAGNPISPRTQHQATLLQDGRVLISGGYCPSYPTVCPGAEIYDPATETFTTAGQIPARDGRQVATRLADGRVLIAFVAGDYWAAVLFDPVKNTFTGTGAPLNQPWRHGVLLLDGTVLFPGPPAERFDPESGTFTLQQDLVLGWNLSSATRLADGQVLFMSGSTVGTDTYSYRWDPVTRRLDTFPQMHDGPTYHTHTLLPNGQLLFTGGNPYYYFENETDRITAFDPGSNTFRLVGRMTSPRVAHTGTLLSDGRVFIAGGKVLTPEGDAEIRFATTEVYDPVSGQSTPAASMSEARELHTATLLRDGRVLIVGGATAELYVPSARTPAPEIYGAAGGSASQGAILHPGTGRLVTANDPAAAGDVVEIYCGGLIDGSVAPPLVSIGGRLAEVLYFGKAPGYDALYQINARIPIRTTAGPAVPVWIDVLDRPSNAVTIGVR